MLATSQIQFDRNCDNCLQMLLEAQQKKGDAPLYSLFFPLPFAAFLFLPFWINNKLAAAKISGQMGLGTLKNLVLHFVFSP